jgi:O-antigen ligase
MKGQNEKIEDAFYHSRGANIKTQWENFLASPLLGHGFGVYPGGIPEKKIVYFMGIPISASTEKGFLPTAALEETGIVGALLLMALLISLGRQVYRQYDPRWLAMYFACLFVNFGESVFLSSGGLGLFFWILIGLCTRGSSLRKTTCAT